MSIINLTSGKQHTMQNVPSPTKLTQTLGLAASIAICFLAAGLGAMATTPEIGGWYSTLNKPTWNPPAALFGPVWSILYLMMAIAAWLVWKPSGIRHAATPLGLFIVQLVLNVAWSWIFFGLHQPGWAFVEIILLWLAIVATTQAFFRRSQAAGWLLVPYLAWVSFASFLNFVIWRMNLS